MAPDFWAVVRIFDRAFGTILRAQIWRSVAIAGFTWFGLSVLERLGVSGPIQYKLLLALWLGLFSLIPEIGLSSGQCHPRLISLTGSGLASSSRVVVVGRAESR
jgi:predicted PurR-regulated permease PerM